MTLWTAAEAAEATGGRAQGDWTATGVSIDTRTIAPGDLFVALTDVRDGHDFVAQALAKGAAAALVSRIPDGVPSGAPLLIVEDVLPALERLGRAARARTSAKVIGVTGSVGKTSTKEMLRTVLGGQGATHAAEASYNNHWGVPLTLARMPRETDFAVIEIGMNHPGEIAPLSVMARPDVAVITTVAAAHLAAFESLEGIAQEKAAIFDGLAANGTAIINGDLPVTPILQSAGAARGKVVRFGEGADNDVRLTDLRLIDTVTTGVIHLGGAEYLLKLNTAGRHFATNAAAVMAVAAALDLDLDLAMCDLMRWQPPAGRGARQKITLDPVEVHLQLTLLDDAFNANPTSLLAALEVLAAARPTDGIGRVAKGRRVAILGDMLELGPDELDLHRQVAAMPPMAQIDVVHACGPMMRSMFEEISPEKRGRWTETAAELARDARHLADAGDVVLVKGSKGSKVSQVVDALRKLDHAPAGTQEETD